jgi:LacI family transcriptional regulator
MSKITIKDIAKMLSISISTVSRALADHPDISDETKIKVKEVAQKFNYLPNLHARFFRKKNTKLIALIIPQFNRFFIPDLIEGIQHVIDKESYSLIIFQSRNDKDIETEIIKYCMSWVVEGVLIALTDYTVELNSLKILKDSNIPVVILDKVIHNEDYPTVTIDDAKAAFIATEAIIKKGKNNILGIFAHENLSITKNRLQGFKKAHIKNNLPFSEKNYIILNHLTELLYLLEERTTSNNFNGLFFMTDELLVNSYGHFLKIGCKIPDELSIVAISDGSSPYFMFPNVSHIFHSGFLIGKVACELLFEKLSDKEKNIEHKIVETNLVDLGSI